MCRLKSVVATATPLMEGAASISRTYMNDMISIQVPATIPIRFKDVMPRDAIHMKKMNKASVISCNVIGLNVLIKVPF